MSRFQPISSDDPYYIGGVSDLASSDLFGGRLAGKHPSSRFMSAFEDGGFAENESITGDLQSVVGRKVLAPVANFESVSIFDDPTEETPFGSAPPSPISQVPTSTINPARPRTVAAGYNTKTKIMTVVFRDGTWWNYFGVPVTVWSNFKAAYSKGRFLYSHGFDDRYGGSSIKYEGTNADTGALSGDERQMLSIRARAVQDYTGGLQSGMTLAGQKRAIKRGYKPGNIGGTARKRAKRP